MQFTNLAVQFFRAMSFFKLGTAVAATDTATITAASMLQGLVVGTPTAAANYTTPTATALITAMGGQTNVKVGDSFDFAIRNISAGAYAITLVAGTDITLATGNTNTVAQAHTRLFRAVVTGVSTPAITIYSLVDSAH